MTEKVCQYCMRYKPKDEVEFLKDRSRWRCKTCKEKNSFRRFKNEEPNDK